MACSCVIEWHLNRPDPGHVFQTNAPGCHRAEVKLLDAATFGVNDCRRDLDALGQRLGFDYSTLHEF